MTSSHGTCTPNAADRPACAAQTYQYAVQNYGKNGSLNWDDFIAMTISGESGLLYQVNPDTKPYSLECGFNVPFPGGDTGKTQAQKRDNCRKIMRLFENLVIGQLVQACGGTTCSEDAFVKYLGGITGLSSKEQTFGIQAWFGAGTPGGTPVAKLFNRLVIPSVYNDPDMRASVQQLLSSPASAIGGNWGTVVSTNSLYWFATKGTGSQYGDVEQLVPSGTVNIS